MRPPSTEYSSVAEARRHDRTIDVLGPHARWRRPLDGRWAFRLFDHPAHVPQAALTGSTAGWRRVAVPGNWTMQGVVDQHGVADLPHYTNVQMPFAGPPPALPARNPTGVHRRTFTVPSAWRGRQVVVHVGGAESAHLVYVNGAFVGYGTDSRLASEYDITSQLRPGRNDLAIVVLRWSAHSYVEDQDQWWMAGLHRSVWIEGRSPTHVGSVRCDVRLSPAERGEAAQGSVAVTVALDGVGEPEVGWRARCWIETLRGRRVSPKVTHAIAHRFAQPYVFGGRIARFELDVAPVDPWSAESPNRYRVAVELLDPDGEVAEARTQLIGFRSVAVVGDELQVNGERIWVFGVNRHDHHPVRGKAVTVDDLRADLLAMRRHNITAVRTSHYPNDPRLLDLCDELGLYVVDEANIESHAYNTSLCDDPRYAGAWLDRGRRMVERDRNHPSVILWSLGNESGYGPHHDALAGWIRASDPSRPLHYEGAVFHAGWDAGGTAASDVVCPMYPSIESIEAYGRRTGTGLGVDRPLVMCEYSHAMGNSNGSLADYWDVITSTPALQGGFLWEWKDHGLETRLPNGRRGFAYGGQFGERPHDGNFVADGLMSADLVPHPAMTEVAWVYRPVTVERAGRARLRIRNRRSFTDLSDLVADWELNVGVDVVATGRLDVAVPPGATVLADLPCDVPSGPDAHLTVRWRQAAPSPWAPAGHLVAWDGIELRPPPRPPRRRSTTAGAPTTPGGPAFGASATPGIARHVASGIELCVFRAPVDNDGFKLMPDLGRRIGVGGTALVAWQDAGVDRLPADEVVDHHHECDVLDEHTIEHRHVVVVPDRGLDLGRIGVTFELRPGFDRLRWFGRGPGENYPDRNRGSMVGTWTGRPDDPPYLVPQEFGLRTDCRWFEFIDPSTGEVLRLDVVDPSVLHVSATRFTAHDLYAAEHETDLRPRRTLVVHADVAHRGLGTASCGPDVLAQYRIAPGTYRFTYRLTAR
jgi:beta-galactosidase